MAADVRRRSAIVAAVVALAAPAEGLRHVAYYDPPGILTVCRGHTGPDVQAGRYYSDGECLQLEQLDAGHAVDQVLRCAPAAPESVAVAFADLTFNAGPTAACDRVRSTAARYLAAGRWRAACEELPKWDKTHVAGQLVALPGLTRRRAMERNVCLGGLQP